MPQRQANNALSSDPSARRGYRHTHLWLPAEERWVHVHRPLIGRHSLEPSHTFCAFAVAVAVGLRVIVLAPIHERRALVLLEVSGAMLFLRAKRPPASASADGRTTSRRKMSGGHGFPTDAQRLLELVRRCDATNRAARLLTAAVPATITTGFPMSIRRSPTHV